jgi:cell shape-determining protein MreC
LKRRSRERSGAGTALIAGVILLAPVAWNVTERYRSPTGPQRQVEEVRELLRQTELEAECLRLRDELDSATRIRVALNSAEGSSTRYAAQLAEILPFGDPSTDRSALWIFVGQSAHPPEDSALVYHHAVAGRLVRNFPGGIALAQTLLDRGFRLRFQCDGYKGILAGTGRREDVEPFLPLLEAIHVTPVGTLPPGSLVTTSGGDGIFPPGLLIGQVAGEEVAITGGHQMIRAVLTPDEIHSVVVVSDAARRAYSTMKEEKDVR